MTPVDPQAQAAGQSWPEQDAAEAWWQKYSPELRFAVTQARLREQEKVEGLRLSLDSQTATINRLQDKVEELVLEVARYEMDANTILDGLKLDRVDATNVSKKLIVISKEIQRLRKEVKP